MDYAEYRAAFVLAKQRRAWQVRRDKARKTRAERRADQIIAYVKQCQAVREPVTRQGIADQLGVSVYQVSHYLTLMKNEGYIAVESGRDLSTIKILKEVGQ